ncbi:MAG: phosphohistidine phosphatase SixA [Acidobacteriia bacterium]|nr:phosphohistidine phosphatase SixA [Terriglobia bacterium]
MNLYLLRHAIAVDHGTPGFTEEKRPLTAEGRAKMRRSAEGMKARGIKVDVIATSPLVRARQTADITAAALGAKDKLQEISALKPGTPFEKLWAALKPFSRCQDLMLVGHEPYLSELISAILTGRPSGVHVVVKKGGLCKLEIDGIPPKGKGILHWLLTNKQLREME